jgi:hypothetical protein
MQGGYSGPDVDDIGPDGGGQKVSGEHLHPTVTPTAPERYKGPPFHRWRALRVALVPKIQVSLSQDEPEPIELGSFSQPFSVLQSPFCSLNLISIQHSGSLSLPSTYIFWGLCL